MKKNRLALILTLFLLLAAIFLVIQQSATSTIQSKDAEFSVLDTASVSKIFIADQDSSEVLLERTGEGWKVNKTNSANQQKIDVMLNTMMKLRVRAPVSKASYNNVVTRMAGLAIKVEVFQIVPRINLFDKIKLFPHEKRTKVYYVGDVTKDNMGTYMLMEGAKNAYVMYITGFKGFVMSRYNPNEEEWREHVIFRKKLGQIQSVQVEFQEQPYQSFKIEKTAQHNYKITRIADNHIFRAYDTLRVLNYLTAFNDVRFEAFLNNSFSSAKKDSITQSPFLHRITLVDVNGKTDVVTTFTKKKYAEHLDIEDKLIPVDLDRMYALVNENRDFVLIQYFTFDKLLKPALYFEVGAPEM